MDIIPASPAPEFRDVSGWANTAPLSINGLKGKVILLDCWTYTCIFCLRTIPIMRRLQEKYGKYGLQVVEAHSAEYEFATKPENIMRALQTLNISEPVAFDTKNKVWEAYGNMYWPKHVLIDHNGLIRYEHAGYGGFADFEDAIVDLLADAGQKPTEPLEDKEPSDNIYDTYGMHFYGMAPEICVGYSRLRRFGNNQTLKPDLQNTVMDTSSHDVNVVYLRGKWIWQRESVQISPGGKEMDPAVIMNYNSAKKVNCIMGTSDGSLARAEIRLDGKPLHKSQLGKHARLHDGKSHVDVDWSFVYNIVSTETAEMHDIEIIPRTNNLIFYTFVFG
jgi:thiol-disulfide isomerase/thioredoxin